MNKKEKVGCIVAGIVMAAMVFGWVAYINVYKTNNQAIGKALLRDAGR